jgi:hypothetical protein
MHRSDRKLPVKRDTTKVTRTEADGGYRMAIISTPKTIKISKLGELFEPSRYFLMTLFSRHHSRSLAAVIG